MKNAILNVAAVVGLSMLASCGTVNEKTAPCKRPTNLTSFAADPRHDCGPMRAVNDPGAAFAAIGIVEPDGQ